MINFLEQAEKLIRINSLSQAGNEELAVHLQGLMRHLGMKTTLQEVAHSLDGVSKRQFNIFGIFGDPLVDRKTRKGLLLITHVDTVDPGIQMHWTETGGDPYKATIKGDRIYGLGTADAKLDFLCKLKAVERYRERKVKMPIYLAGTAGEEIGMIGARFLIKSLILNPRYVVVGEPTELAIVHSHKADALYQVTLGYSQLERDAKGYNTRIELQCFGRAAHGANPALGDSAIHRMLSVIHGIKEANFQIKLTRIAGGDSVSRVPDTAIVEFYIPSSSFDDFSKFFREHYGNEDIRVEYGGLGESGMRFMPENMLDAIESVQGVLGKLQAEVLNDKDESFRPAESTVNLGRTLTRPSLVELHLDFRLLPSVNTEMFDQKLRATIQELNSRFSNLTIRAARMRINPALAQNEGDEFIKAGLDVQRAAGITPKLATTSASTEAAQFHAAGFDTLAFGPGSNIGNGHAPNEYNLVEHLDRAVHFYDKMIERFCL